MIHAVVIVKLGGGERARDGLDEGGDGTRPACEGGDEAAVGRVLRAVEAERTGVALAGARYAGTAEGAEPGAERGAERGGVEGGGGVFETELT